ncbi:MAG TPA: aminotransferase class V-fold PLP-dependent enzyme [Bryobacteraceae bacterium]|nr:aminotransferase class V-fold PLP-dependent enzyme [Bryobacteraceae bacterium]
MPLKKRTGTCSRRDLLQAGPLTVTAGLFGPAAASAASLPKRGDGPEVYTRLGVRPFINCTSTYTINGGSALLPEVVEAIRQASHYHVNIDELMAAVGERIARQLGVPAAMVSSGAAGAVTCGTVACLAGGDPETMQQLPDTTGLPNEVIVPRWSRSAYDHAVRNSGARMVEVETLEDVRRALNSRVFMATAQANILDAGNRFSLGEFAQALHSQGVPLLIDGAAELPLRPNPFLAGGADLVAYSCGKILRGPQTAGILVGRPELVRAAYACSSPHITFARAIKVSKEEIVGALVAVETLVHKRDRDAEDREWRSWYDYIISRLAGIPGVQTAVIEPTRKSYYPVLQIEWDGAKVSWTAGQVGKMLLDGEPRIMTHAEGEGRSFVIRPAAMYPGEYKLVAERLHEVLSKSPALPLPAPPEAPATDLSGAWEVEIRFVAGKTKQRFQVNAQGNTIAGTYSSRVVRTGTLRGTVSGAHVEIRTSGAYEGAVFGYRFTGRIAAGEMSGDVELGEEYGRAHWTARRV